MAGVVGWAPPTILPPLPVRRERAGVRVLFWRLIYGHLLRPHPPQPLSHLRPNPLPLPRLQNPPALRRLGHLRLRRRQASPLRSGEFLLARPRPAQLVPVF